MYIEIRTQSTSVTRMRLFLCAPPYVGVPSVIQQGHSPQKPAGTFFEMFFLTPRPPFPWRFLIYVKTKGDFMKIKFFIVGACLLCGSAWAECSIIGLSPGQTCSGVGGKYCSDGTCRVCCPTEGGGSGSGCSGTSTTDTSETFSNSIGSGYIYKQIYSGTCRCASM